MKQRGVNINTTKNVSVKYIKCIGSDNDLWVDLWIKLSMVIHGDWRKSCLGGCPVKCLIFYGDNTQWFYYCLLLRIVLVHISFIQFYPLFWSTFHYMMTFLKRTLVPGNKTPKNMWDCYGIQIICAMIRLWLKKT